MGFEMALDLLSFGGMKKYLLLVVSTLIFTGCDQAQKRGHVLRRPFVSVETKTQEKQNENITVLNEGQISFEPSEDLGFVGNINLAGAGTIGEDSNPAANLKIFVKGTIPTTNDGHTPFLFEANELPKAITAKLKAEDNNKVLYWGCDEETLSFQEEGQEIEVVSDDTDLRFQEKYDSAILCGEIRIPESGLFLVADEVYLIDANIVTVHPHGQGTIEIYSKKMHLGGSANTIRSESDQVSEETRASINIGVDESIEGDATLEIRTTGSKKK